MYELIGDDIAQAPREVKGAMLSCILSDTLHFRSPTTTQTDEEAYALLKELGMPFVRREEEAQPA